MRWNVRIFAKYVKSRDNDFADALSRLQFSRFNELAAEAGKNFDKPEKLPMELVDIHKRWIK